MKLPIYALIGASLFPFCAGAVENNPLELVITPTRTATPLKAIGSSVTIVTAEEIERKQIRTVAEALQDVPGVSISSSGGRGQTTSVFIRGAKSEHTLVIIDGVEMNDPATTGNAYDFSRLTTDNIERIEVLRGAQSTLYGTDAIGGVISIITKKGSGPAQFTGSAEYGSYNSSVISGGVRGSTDHVGYSLAASNDQTNGFSAFNKHRGGVEDDSNRTSTFSGRLDGKINEQFGAYATARYNNTRAEYDDFGADAGNLTEADEFSGRVAATAKLWDGKWTQELGVSHLNLDRDTDSTFGANQFEGERTKFDWIHTITPVVSHVITGGIETAEDHFTTDTDGSHDNRTNAAFLQDQWNIVENLYVTFGGRFDDNEQFGSEGTYRIAPTYTIASTGTQLKSSYGTGFKAPSLYQIYSIFGNVNLNPEKSKSFDIGFEQPLLNNRLRFGSSYFHNDIEDLIDYDFITNAYANFGDARTRGFESFVHYSPIASVSLSLTHTFTLAETTVDDTELVRRPRHTFSFDADWDVTDTVSVGAEMNYVGRRNDFDLSFSPTRMGGYPLLNLHGDWDVTPHVSLYGRIVNLLDRDYENVYGYGTAGVSGYAGMRVNY